VVAALGLAGGVHDVVAVSGATADQASEALHELAETSLFCRL
jgi:hypothetical protein